MAPELNGTGDTGTTNFLGKFTGNGLNASLVASQIFDDGTHIGIGTQTPNRVATPTVAMRVKLTSAEMRTRIARSLW